MYSPEAQNYFSKPGIFLKTSQSFLFLWVFFSEFRHIYASKECKFCEKLGFYDAKYQNFRPIFAAARKNIFG